VDPVVVVILRGALALLFAAAAVHKLRGGAAFRETLSAYALLPEPAVAPAARVLPGLELAIALALAVPAAAAAGALAAAGLLVLYAAAMAINLARGRRDLDCGCFGPAAGRTIGGALVLRNGVLVAAALACAVAPTPRALQWLDLFTATLALAALTALYAAADRLLAQGPALARLRAETRA